MFTCSGWQKMWASSCWNLRTRVSPLRAPDSSFLCNTPKSAILRGNSRHDRWRWSNIKLNKSFDSFPVKSKTRTVVLEYRDSTFHQMILTSAQGNSLASGQTSLSQHQTGTSFPEAKKNILLQILFF